MQRTPIPASHPFAESTVAAKERTLYLGRSGDSAALDRLHAQLAAQRKLRKCRREVKRMLDAVGGMR